MLQRFSAKPEDAGIDSNNMYKAALLPSIDDDYQYFDFWSANQCVCIYNEIIALTS